jgi:SAM-dependent methyltransferase
MEPFFPLTVRVCQHCFLVQLDEYVGPDVVFGADYPYYSSYSDSWLAHAKTYCDQITRDFGIGDSSFVVELASNDGYLLQNFVQKNISCLGIEPAAGVADAAIAVGVPTLNRFFGVETAAAVKREYRSADLIIGNNVLAHVPDINDFVEGIEILLAPTGIATLEFPHLARLIESNQFDTIYHEHYSYLSFTTVCRVFEAHGLQVFDVEELPTHGGSLRVYACRAENTARGASDRSRELTRREFEAGLSDVSTYALFGARVEATKRKLLSFLIEAKNANLRIAGYGAPGKGNTLLNYCGIRSDFLDYTVDRNPHKQGTYTPGTRIPIFDPSRIFETKPDFLLLLPWNIKDEIMSKMSGIRDWGGKFVVPIPEVAIL